MPLKVFLIEILRKFSYYNVNFLKILNQTFVLISKLNLFYFFLDTFNNFILIKFAEQKLSKKQKKKKISRS
jgi:hypothetical protein